MEILMPVNRELSKSRLGEVLYPDPLRSHVAIAVNTIPSTQSARSTQWI